MKSIILTAAVLLGILMQSCGSTTDKTPDPQAADAYNVILTRHSVRDYTDEPLDEAMLGKLLRAGMSAPTAMDKRPWKFVAVEGEALKAFADSLNFPDGKRKAPLAIVVCGYAPDFIEGAGRDFWVQDCSAATENILLAAHSMQLGSCWNGVYPINERVRSVRAALDLPDTLIPLCYINIGYPATEQDAKDKWTDDNVIRRK